MPRISEGAQRMGLRVMPFDPDGRYVVKDIFTTVDGSWEPSGHPYSVPQWARDAYLKPWGAPDYFDDAGGATHLFAAVIGSDGELLRDYPIHYTSDNWNTRVTMQTKRRSGWANLFMSGSSAFWPGEGQRGPWQWAPNEGAQKVTGGGLPERHHISTFVVWEERTTEPEPPVTPPDDDCEEAMLRIVQWSDEAHELLLEAAERIERIGAIARGED